MTFEEVIHSLMRGPFDFAVVAGAVEADVVLEIDDIDRHESLLVLGVVVSDVRPRGECRSVLKAKRLGPANTTGVSAAMRSCP